MNSWIDPVLNYLQNSNFAAILIDAALKSFVILILASVTCVCLRKAAAATRHWIWLLAAVSLLMLPVLSLVLPAWERPLWTVSTELNSGNQLTMAVEFVPIRNSRNAILAINAAETPKPQTSQTASGRTQRIRTQFGARWLVFAALIWFSGVILMLSWFAVGQLRLRKMIRRGRVPGQSTWMPLFDGLCKMLNLRRRVILLQSSDNLMPMTFRWWRPVILLPGEADQWSMEKKRVVLLHELAHIKRWDCLTQMVTNIICGAYWVNPLVWLASRRMCIERERACDDLVLHLGCKASDYAGHLVEIARSFRRVPQGAAIAMARSPQLENRVAAIVDASRPRLLNPAMALTILGLMAGLVICMGGCKAKAVRKATGDSSPLRQQQIAQLKNFSIAKEKQSQSLAAREGDSFFPDFQIFFNAATRGDGRTVTNMYENFKKRHGQYENTTGDLPHKSYWSPVLEVSLGYYDVMAGEPKYVQLAIDGIINSIPAGSIYFGGTDPGRGLPTAFSRSHVNADPFFTLTQNALADGTYLKYLRETYGGKIYTPTDEDSQRCFNEYLADAESRLKENKLKPGESVKMVDGKVQVQGQVAVMAINALLTKLIFEKNPNHEFYIEESFPLDWMYPHLEPHGLIMKINRQPLERLSDKTIQQDREYWRQRVSGMVGDGLTEDASVQTAARLAEKIYLHNNLKGFKGDQRFIESDHAQKLFSKLRSSIGGVYAWRAAQTADQAEKTRLMREADLAFRQAFVMCPDSPEAVFRYANLLVSQNRISDALRVAETAERMPEVRWGPNKTGQMRNLVNELKKLQKE